MCNCKQPCCGGSCAQVIAYKDSRNLLHATIEECNKANKEYIRLEEEGRKKDKINSARAIMKGLLYVRYMPPSNRAGEYEVRVDQAMNRAIDFIAESWETLRNELNRIT